jgi:hypothetical protein
MVVCLPGKICGVKLSRGSVSVANSILAAFEMGLFCAIPVRQSLPTRLNPREERGLRNGETRQKQSRYVALPQTAYKYGL